jgi:GNAT superfamily N-acetyltransferase
MSSSLPVLLRIIEYAAVRGWPALEREDVSGWLWRHTSGGSIRANSTATLSFTGDLNRAIVAVEKRYRARQAASVFTICDVSEPGSLDAALDRRGYERGNDHLTMVMPLVRRAVVPEDVYLSTQPRPDWIEVYLSGLSPDRRDIAPRLLANLPPTAVYVGVMNDGKIVSCGLTIVDGSVASVQCMATLPEARRNGGALRVLTAIATHAFSAGAAHLYLQTGGENTSAQSLYRKFGFEVAGTYHTRTKAL